MSGLRRFQYVRVDQLDVGDRVVRLRKSDKEPGVRPGNVIPGGSIVSMSRVYLPNPEKMWWIGVGNDLFFVQRGDVYVIDHYVIDELDAIPYDVPGFEANELPQLDRTDYFEDHCPGCRRCGAEWKKGEPCCCLCAGRRAITARLNQSP